MSDSKNSFTKYLFSKFPELKSLHDDSLVFETLIDDNLLSPFVIELPKSTLIKIKSIINAFYAARESKEYVSNLNLKYSKNIPDPGNKALFMSYDFHLNTEGEPKLIEINTNAAFLALGYYYYQSQNRTTGLEFKIENLREDFLEELRLFGRPDPSPQIIIMDENPPQQKLYAEFLVYQQLIKSFGWECVISDYRDALKSKPQLIYNRWTDFYFTNTDSQDLNTAFINKQICFSPNPYEYFLLADKQRLVDLNDESFLNQLPISTKDKMLIQGALPLSQLFASYDRSELWTQRKKFFFKPLTSFGSKQTYKGASISKKLFDELPKNEFLAQEYVPAPEKEFLTPSGPDKFKFDLRCYAYKNKLQLVIARVYKGQVTNLKTPYGGFALLNWV